MSIDLEVIPTAPSDITWQRLRNCIMELSNEADKTIEGMIELTLSNGDSAVGQTELLVGGIYSVSFGVLDRFDLDIQSNERCGTDEVAVLDEYGSNIDHKSKLKTSQQWKKVGYSFGITSYGNRSDSAHSTMMLLAAAIASLCEGLVLVKQEGGLFCRDRSLLLKKSNGLCLGGGEKKRTKNVPPNKWAGEIGAGEIGTGSVMDAGDAFK